MRKSFLVLAIVGLLVGVLAAPVSARGEGNPNTIPVDVYVTSQMLAYDTIGLASIPFVPGTPYQELEMGVGPTGLQTEFGPGDQEYVGGRWWVDNKSAAPATIGVMGPEDSFFMCPLLGPGRETA